MMTFDPLALALIALLGLLAVVVLAYVAAIFRGWLLAKPGACWLFTDHKPEYFWGGLSGHGRCRCGHVTVRWSEQPRRAWGYYLALQEYIDWPAEWAKDKS